MAENYTLLFLSQHYPTTQQLQVISYESVSADTNVADFLKKSEQQVSQKILDNIYVFASAALQNAKVKKM